MTAFLHGVEIVEVERGNRPIQTVRSSVIGIVGTAPGADASAFPLNTPVLIAGSKGEAAKLWQGTGPKGTLPLAVDKILDQIGALIVVVRVEVNASPATELANVIGGVNSGTGAYTGLSCFLGAESAVGVQPRILIAPGYTSSRPTAGDPPTAGPNPVVTALIPIAERLRAIIVADGPSTTDAAALAWANDFDSRRVYVVDPAVVVLDTLGDTAVNATLPASAVVAGVIARSDNERGFWWSPSNRVINGVLGLARPIDFSLGDPNSRANLLNEGNVTTIIREGGFRLWGNRTLASTDLRWAFLSVVRTADMINDSIKRAHLWAVDRNINRRYLDEVTGGVNAYLRQLVALEAILGGTCWADPDLNTPESIAQGRVYFNFDFTPPAPAERVTFRSILTNDYIETILEG